MRYLGSHATYQDQITNAKRSTSGNYVLLRGLGTVSPPRLVASTLGGHGIYAGYGGLGATGKLSKGAAIAQKQRTYEQLRNVKINKRTFWTDINNAASIPIRPFEGALAAVIGKRAARMFVEAPVNGILGLFDPIIDLVGKAIDNVLKKHGNTQDFFGTRIDCNRKPKGDASFDRPSRNLMLRMRTVRAFCVLFFTQSIDLMIEMGKEGLEAAGHAIESIGKATNDAGKAVAKTTGDIVKNIGDGFNAAGKGIKDFFGLNGVGGLDGVGDMYGYGAGMGLGQGGPAEAAVATAAVGTTAVAGPSAVVFLGMTIAELIAVGGIGATVIGAGAGVITASSAADKAASDERIKKIEERIQGKNADRDIAVSALAAQATGQPSITEAPTEGPPIALIAGGAAVVAVAAILLLRNKKHK